MLHGRHPELQSKWGRYSRQEDIMWKPIGNIIDEVV